MGIGGGGSRKFCQGWGYGGLLFSQPSTYFTEGRTNLPWVQLLLEGGTYL